MLLCRGNGASVARIVPYAALHFSTYEHYRGILVRNWRSASMDDGDLKDPGWIDLLAGALSGATAVSMTYPLDLIRTRLAWETCDNGSSGSTILGKLQKVFQQEGAAGLYRVWLFGLLSQLLCCDWIMLPIVQDLMLINSVTSITQKYSGEALLV